MALTLTEGNKYSTTRLQKGVIATIVLESPILQRLPFKEIIGNSLTYNRIDVRPTTKFYSPGDVWSEDTMTLTQKTATLSILGGDVDIDEFIRKTRSDINDVKQEQITEKSLALRDTYLDGFYYGDVTANAKAFDGLQKLIADTTYNTVNAGTGTGSALSIDKLRQAIDLMRFKPSLIVSSRKMRRLMTTYFESIGSAFPSDRDEFGSMVKFFNDVPWAVDDNILDTETAASGAYSAKTGGTNTTIFILSFDPLAVSGLQNGKIAVDEVGRLESKDADRVRIKWYCGAMLQSLRGGAKVDGIATGSAVVA